MNFKKIIATVAAAAVAVTTMAVSAFAIDLDSSYTGDWSLSSAISKADLTAIGGDVQITINYTVEAKTPHIFAPANAETWDHLADMAGTNAKFSSADLVSKPDGFFAVRSDKTSATFVISADAIANLGDTGLAFQVNNVTINSAELAAGTLGDEITRIAEGDVEAFNNGSLDPWAAPAEDTAAAEDDGTEAVEEDTDDADDTVVADDDADDAVVDDAADDAADEDVTVENTAADTTDDAPAADTTTPVATGNTSAAVILSVMAVAGAVAIAAKKRK
ncbi:MAG: hypothetical protein ACI4I2_03635 [Oscillospiraceae bacterium]